MNRSYRLVFNHCLLMQVASELAAGRRKWLRRRDGAHAPTYLASFTGRAGAGPIGGTGSAPLRRKCRLLEICGTGTVIIRGAQLAR